MTHHADVLTLPTVITLSVQPLSVKILGGLEVYYGNERVRTLTRRRVQLLLAYLVLHQQRTITRREIIYLFWADTSETQAHSNLRSALSRLKQAFPPLGQFLEIDDQFIQWRKNAPVWSDVTELEAALARLSVAETRRNRRELIGALQQVVDLYSGELLPDYFDEWVLAYRQRLQHAFLHALDWLIELLKAEGDYGTAIRYTQRRLTHDPLSETAHHTLMELYLLNGDRAGAMQVYQACVVLLRRELEVEPGPAIQRLYAAMTGEAQTMTAAASAREAVLLQRIVQSWRLSTVHSRSPAGSAALCALLVNTLAQQGKYNAALTLVDEALTQISSRDSQSWRAEFHRLRAHLLQRQGAGPEKVEAALVRASELARQAGALTVLLKATVERAVLWQQQGRHGEVPRLLAELDGWLPLALQTEEVGALHQLLSRDEW